MRSWLISALAVKTQQRGLEALEQLCPFDWLVWEPGQWRPSASNLETVKSLPQVLATAKPPEVAESLVMALEPTRERGEVTLGRTGCDLVIDDRTLSSHHLTFNFDEYHWWVRDAGSRNGSLIDGRKLTREPVRLDAGTRLQAAQVTLTFYTRDAMYERLLARTPVRRR